MPSPLGEVAKIKILAGEGNTQTLCKQEFTMPLITQKIGKLEYLTAENIAAPHAFTTRLGGVSAAPFDSLNIGMHRGDSPENVEENFRILSSAIGFSLENTVLTHQVHTDIVRVVTKSDACGLDNHGYPECDALITNDPGTVLTIFTADCTPILLWDCVTGAVGAAHAGWRGTAMNIAGKTAWAMVERLGCKPENLRAAIGPNISVCCFETTAEVPEAMLRQYGKAVERHIRPAGDKYYVNLKAINAHALRAAGIENIEISDECTMCQHHRFWSHRYTRGNRGSQGAVIICKEVTP